MGLPKVIEQPVKVGLEHLPVRITNLLCMSALDGKTCSARYVS